MSTHFNNLADTVLEWLISVGPAVVTIIIGAFLAGWVIMLMLRKAIRRVVIKKGGELSEREQDQRVNTLQHVAGTTVRILIIVVTIMVLLSELGLDIGPLLATAGVAGFALGFGAQYLIRDLISGFFIIIEEQYSVGDIVCLGDTCGAVEEITLRMTKLRDLDGVAHYVPNSEIKVASNMSQHFSRVNLNIGVAYESDIDQVIQVINRVGDELSEDAEWGQHIIKAPQFFRVDDLGDSAIYLKIVGDVQPGQQWAVTGELRRRLKNVFDDEHIEIPFPQQVLRQVSGDMVNPEKEN